MSRMNHRFATLGLALALAAAGVQAAAPQIKTQAPGYYRMMLGDFEITALNDGTLDLPVDQLMDKAKPGTVVKALEKNYLKPPVETSVNGYLINTGTKLVLIDTGAAGLFGPTAGRLLANLKAAGYQPEQVDEIYITHLHPDHAGGLTQDGKPVFPNAVVRMDQHDADHWLNEANAAKEPEGHRGFFPGVIAALKPYQDAGRVKPFDGATELMAGIRAVPAPGHTPGHTVYMVESKGQQLAVWGDLMHVAAVQFPTPSVAINFDSDSKRAVPQREKAFADAAKKGYYVAVAHVSFPGIGHLRSEGKGYVWVPVNYSIKP
ncbi:MBL fold metallo-hydrolase [Roseateles terrae]|uniref:Glyoxylase-like metal-dependent hydrolase (Beta-lactamase superfamily II) n=2 Tax=Roseateles terrae TaxID=431060 RepID=A0ABR6GS88_9BURK|nr:glyoxylase-like metal-dependent hydrolase (beta-lactamase superfamily II) [Roseateles terrae]OWQ85795.1 MBL fold metallo-hydrolase [Roseateles terrae]